MSRKQLVFLLSELGLVRVVCQTCKTVVELPLADLPKHAWDRCAFCQALLGPARAAASPLVNLVQAILQAQAQAGAVEVEFVLPDNGAAPPP